MNVHAIKERHGIWWGCATAAIFTAAAFYLRTAGYGAVIFIGICGLFVTLAVLWGGVQTKIFSKEGICVKRIFKTSQVSWGQIEKIEIVWMRLGNANPSWYISITWPPQNDRKTWVQHWLWWMKLDNKSGFLFPYTDELHAAIVRYYGPVDFDGRNETHAVID